ncbi:hypothetical protein A2U01_0090361, partial [Trifolium medium]|nr:hypothetical protein [Trifolium medium]
MLQTLQIPPPAHSRILVPPCYS